MNLNHKMKSSVGKQKPKKELWHEVILKKPHGHNQIPSASLRDLLQVSFTLIALGVVTMLTPFCCENIEVQ